MPGQFSQSFVKFLGAEPDEAAQVYLLLGLGFLLGLFTASFMVVGETLFVENFDQQVDLPKAFIAQGVTGLLLTYIFAFYQNRIDFGRLVSLYLTGIAITVFLISLGLVYLPDTQPLIFMIFVLIPPLGVILLLIFWGTFNRLFNLRQAKRIIGSIDTGMLVAAILSFFSIPQVLKLLDSTSQLLYISCASIVGLLILFNVLNAKFPLTVDHKKTHMKKGERSISKLGFSEFFKKRYLQYMVVFVTISMVAVDFLDYSFFTVAESYFISEEDLAVFLSYFNGTIVVFSFLFQTFITDKIISEYGLKVALLINPILLTIFMGIATVVGMIVGVEAGSENIIAFFIIVAMGKLFINSLKDALDGPSFKLYFLPIKSNIRFDIQTKVEGVITVFSGIISGGLILLITYSEAFGILEVTIFMFPILALWYWITIKMHNRYRLTLKETLEDNKKAARVITKHDQAIYQLLADEINEEDSREVIYALELMEKLDPVKYEEFLHQLKNTNREASLLDFVNQKLNDLEINTGTLDENKLIAEEGVSEVRQLAIKAINNAEHGELLSLSTQRLNTLSKSRNPEMRILAVKLLRKLINDDNVFILMELLRDPEPEVKTAAITTARKTQRPESWSTLIELLASPYYSHHAASTLIDTGERALITLESAFHKSGQSEEVMSKIVQIYGRIGSAKALDLLWNKIEYPDKMIVSEVLSAFKVHQVKADDHRINAVNNLLDQEIGCCLWNLASLTELSDEEPGLMPLRKAIKEEIEQNFENVYTLLALIYEPQSIQLVKDNIEIGTAEGVAFAIELLDVFLDPKLKLKLIPLIDDISVSDKIKMLQIMYPRERFTEDQAVLQIINRDYNYLNRWTKACAIYSLSFKNEYQISDDIIAHLFNPDPLIRETASWIIHSKDKQIFNKVSTRLAPDLKKSLIDILNYFNKGNIFELKIRKAIFLSELADFEGIPGIVLAELVEIVQEIELDLGQRKKLLNDLESPFYVLVQGRVGVGENNEMILEKGEVFSEARIRFYANSATIEALEDSMIFKFDKDRFFQIMIRYNQLANRYIKHIKLLINPNLMEENLTEEEDTW